MAQKEEGTRKISCKAPGAPCAPPYRAAQPYIFAKGKNAASPFRSIRKRASIEDAEGQHGLSGAAMPGGATVRFCLWQKRSESASEQHQGSFAGTSAAKSTEGVVLPFPVQTHFVGLCTGFSMQHIESGDGHGGADLFVKILLFLVCFLKKCLFCVLLRTNQ
ncbi:MAG: hypothetical protein E7424_07035 [Ruminococcaceae bacterium]|nr:hypothetical protein [Oscillospiraceae bacterium]